MRDVDPFRLARLAQATQNLGFQMASTPVMGRLLRTLANSRRTGNLLEIGTGTGVGTAWLLDGMTSDAKLTTIEIDATLALLAHKEFSDDPRVSVVSGDALTFLENNVEKFDLIFADFRPGKFVRLDLALDALVQGGIYIVDDLLPQPTWPPGHQQRIDQFFKEIEARSDMCVCFLNYDSGILIGTRK